jgi:hypothetical protein
MKYQTAIVFLYSGLSLASEQTCELNSNLNRNFEENLNQIVNHVDYSGSCIDKWSMKPNDDWKKNIDQMVGQLPRTMKNKSRHYLDLESMRYLNQDIDQFDDFDKNHPDLKKLDQESEKYRSNEIKNQKYKKELIDELKINNSAGRIPEFEKKNILNSFVSRGIKLSLQDIPTYESVKLNINTAFHVGKDAFKEAFKNAWATALELKTEQAKQQLKSIAENKMCVKGAEFKVEAEEGFYSQTFNSDSDADAAAEKLKSVIKQTESQNHSNTKFFCSPISSHLSELAPVENKLEVDLQGTTFFNDNEFDLSKSQTQLIDKKIAEQITKLKSLRPTCDVVIKKVDIFSSSSLLRNRIKINGVEDESKSWDFNWLSQKRAQNFSDHLMKKHKVSNSNISISAKGGNGDGTSGPCPYYYDGKTIKIKSDLNLDKYKYVKASIEFDLTGKNCLNTEKEFSKPVKHHRTQCFRASINCLK